jgi:hypothetical protein
MATTSVSVAVTVRLKSSRSSPFGFHRLLTKAPVRTESDSTAKERTKKGRVVYYIVHFLKLIIPLLLG